jgi:hypothetical protein
VAERSVDTAFEAGREIEPTGESQSGTGSKAKLKMRN